MCDPLGGPPKVRPLVGDPKAHPFSSVNLEKLSLI